MFFSVLESLTLVFGLAYVLLQVKQSRWMWPVDILCCIAAVIVFAHQRLWASMGLNVYYLIMGFVGIVAWNKDAQKVENEQMRVRKMSRKTLAVSLLAMVVSGIGLYYVLKLSGSGCDSRGERHSGYGVAGSHLSGKLDSMVILRHSLDAALPEPGTILDDGLIFGIYDYGRKRMAGVEK